MAAPQLSGNTLLSFAALRRQAVGAGASFKTRVVVRIAAFDGEARVALCVKDARIAAQQPATRLRSCEPAPWPQRGRRLWLTFDSGGDGARRFDVELQTDAEVALLKARAHARRPCAAARLLPAEACAQFVCDALVADASGATMDGIARSAAARRLLGADPAVLKRGGTPPRLVSP